LAENHLIFSAENHLRVSVENHLRVSAENYPSVSTEIHLSVLAENHPHDGDRYGSGYKVKNCVSRKLLKVFFRTTFKPQGYQI
jgi:hypothetical protein